MATAAEHRDQAQVLDLEALRGGVQAFAVLNMGDRGVVGADDREGAEAVQDVPELQLLDTPLRQRKALANASSAGLHITELRPSDPKACHEVAAIVAAIYSA